MESFPECTPRINGQMLQDYVGMVVTLVGRIVAKNPGHLTLAASDGTTVDVISSPDCDYSSAHVEIRGKVNENMTVQEYKSTPLNDNFDMENYNKLVQLSAGQFKNLFVAE